MCSVDTFTWFEITCLGSVPKERHSHVACLTNSRIAIFGGINNEHYCTSDVYILEMGMQLDRPFGRLDFDGVNKLRDKEKHI